ncbi:MAG: hypothetical protein RLZZ383_111 [Pseudomonadota bacterium]|jgi:hypothetical protein
MTQRSSMSGPALRARREALGLPAGAVADALGINVEAVLALESGDPDLAGPHASVWLEAYEAWIVDAVEHPGSTATPPPDDVLTTTTLFGGVAARAPSGARLSEAVRRASTTPSVETSVPTWDDEDDGRLYEGDDLPVLRRRVRRLGFATLAIAAVAVGIYMSGWRWRTLPPPAPVQVEVLAQFTTPLVIRVDGVEVVRREFAGAEAASFRGQRSVEIDVTDIEALKLTFEGRTIAPRGRVRVPRTLRFEAGGGSP